MAEVLTTKMKNDVTRSFYNDILDNDYYVFVSSVTQGNDRDTARNSQFSKSQFLENTVFGKKVFNSDTKFMIKYYPWQKDQVYVQYDDNEDMDGKRFYTVVGPNNNDTGDYRVFKCLSNNNDTPSSAPPNWNPFTTDQVYRTADGYVWKFLYYIEASEFEAYNALGFIPLIGSNFVINPDPNADANNVVYGSEISDIFVSNPVDNAGYQTLSGFVGAAPGNDGTITIKGDNINQITNYYSGMSIYTTNTSSNNISFLYKIIAYSYEPSTGFGKVVVDGTPLQDGVLNNASFVISPSVEIKGDGTGAKAIPNVIDGNISSLLILDHGKNYTSVVANVVDPLYDFDPEDPNSIDVRAILRPVLSPFGGHGYNLIDELHCRHILLYGYINETDNNQIGATNTYSYLGVVKNPEFVSASANTANTPDVFDNRIEIETNDTVYAVVDSTVKQLDADNNITFTAKIHEVDPNANKVYLNSYMGPYQNQANNDISLDPTRPLINETGQSIRINSPIEDNLIESDYIQKTGEVYFMEDFTPLARTFKSREEYKLVLEF